MTGEQVEIKVAKVNKVLRGKQVLRDLDLEVMRGETLVIIGRSGTGKSVLLKHIIGLIRPDSGRIFVGGDELTGKRESALEPIRRRLGMLFQNAALLNSLTVGENVGLGLREARGLKDEEIRKIVTEKLELVGLGGTEDVMPAELSGGMKKRVGLARALAMEPEIMLYDEPTAGLDPVMSQNIDELIMDMKDKLRMTSIVVTHDMISTFGVADTVGMLYDGRIIAKGTPDEIEHSKDPVVTEFMERDFTWRRGK